jgi:hypothetical protein
VLEETPNFRGFHDQLMSRNASLRISFPSKPPRRRRLALLTSVKIKGILGDGSNGLSSLITCNQILVYEEKLIKSL